MKNPSPRRVVSPVTYFLSSLFLLLCALLPARAQLPSGWTGANIGSPSGGGESYDSGTQTFTIMGTGQGLGIGLNYNDRFHFTYRAVTGDYEISARVVSFSPSSGQVGLTMRTGLGNADWHGSGFAWLGYPSTPATNYLWEEMRALSDGDPFYYYFQGAENNEKSTLTPPFWIKLVRVGNNYGFYWSKDGHDWFLSNNSAGGPFFATGTYKMGFFVSSNSDTALCTATLDNIYWGAPRPRYKTSWAGSTSAGIADGYPSNQINAMWVKPDGTCYANSNWDEGGQEGKVYKDGKVLHGFYSGGINGAMEGTVTGNGSNIFFYDGVPTPYAPTRAVYRTDFITNTSNLTPITFTGPALGVVGGLAASATRLFVSDTTNGIVRVVDLTLPTPTEITATTPSPLPIPFPHCGPIACDGTNFWITDTASTFPLCIHVTAMTGYTPAIRCYAPDGTNTGRAITDVAIPTALAYDNRNTTGTTTDDLLWVCDNGPNQNVRYYTNLTGPGNPTFAGTFGQSGGIWAGSHPGQITDSASGGDQRFYGPVGVGVDSSLNVYVACNGASGSVTDLRKFNSAGTLQWRQNGLVFVAEGDFDPASDGQDIYLPEKHLKMNYANTAPGSEWAYQGFTRDIRQNANEARTPGAPAAANVCGVKLARLGTGNNLYMYTSGQGNVGSSWLYYFNGETAVPFGTNAMDGAPGTPHRIWIDTNMNGVIDAGETTSAQQSLPGGIFQSFDVDKKGDIWMCSLGGLVGDFGSIRQVKNQGSRTLTNGAVVPNYNLNAGGYVDYIIPAPLRTAWNISYDSDNDILYAIGQTPDGTWKLVRCDKWTANPESQLNPMATWAVNLPAPPDLTILIPPPTAFQYMGMDIAGGKIFVAEVFGPAHVFDATTGNLEFTLNPGAELNARLGWVDMSMGINAFKRSTGEYIILEDNTGFNSCDILYRWTPTADTAVTAAPTALTATAPGRKVLLSWNGPTGMVTSYKLYRGTSAGTETLYQSGILPPTFTDLNVTPGTTYYYKVTAINAAGESAQSNEASATPLSSAAEFVKTDTTTQGNWKGVYGTEGYEICNNTINYPAYVSGVTYTTWTDPAVYPVPPNPVIPVTLGTWANPSTDVRALQKPDPATDRIAAYRGAGGTAWPFSFNFTFTDLTKWHQVAVYIVDWTNTRPIGISAQIVDTATGTVLDTRWLGNHQNGKYLVWNVSGNVQVKIVQHPYTDETVASGVFLDPVQVSTPAIAWWKFEETSGTVAADSSGAGHNATVSGTTWDPSGKIGRSVKIPGGTARVTLPSTLLSSPFAAITLSAWFKTSSTTGAAIAGYANAATSPTIYDPALYVGIDGKLRGTFYTGTISPLTSTATVNDGTWHHAVLVGDVGVQTLYLDGNIVDYRAGYILTPSMPYYYLGYANVSGWPSMSGTTNNFNGWLDDVRIYDKVLTPAQVFQLANP